MIRIIGNLSGDTSAGLYLANRYDNGIAVTTGHDCWYLVWIVPVKETESYQSDTGIGSVVRLPIPDESGAPLDSDIEITILKKVSPFRHSEINSV